MVGQLPSHIQKQVERGISILKQGGLVAFPTDTVYGLGACVNIEQAVERLYQAKKRPRNMALPLLLAHTSQISEVAEPVPEIAWLLARHFLPGALTLVLPKSNSVPDIITAGGMTVAVRIPAHPVHPQPTFLGIPDHLDVPFDQPFFVQAIGDLAGIRVHAVF